MKKIFLIITLLLSTYVYSQTQTFDISIPNAFTPNGDGINDKFSPSIFGHKQAIITIVNRMGVIVYKDIEGEGWDGTYKGTPCGESIYLYQIDVIDTNDKRHTYYGTLLLLRSK